MTASHGKLNLTVLDVRLLEKSSKNKTPTVPAVGVSCYPPVPLTLTSLRLATATIHLFTRRVFKKIRFEMRGTNGCQAVFPICKRDALGRIVFRRNRIFIGSHAKFLFIPSPKPLFTCPESIFTSNRNGY